MSVQVESEKCIALVNGAIARYRDRGDVKAVSVLVNLKRALQKQTGTHGGLSKEQPETPSSDSTADNPNP